MRHAVRRPIVEPRGVGPTRRPAGPQGHETPFRNPTVPRFQPRDRSASPWSSGSAAARAEMSMTTSGSNISENRDRIERSTTFDAMDRWIDMRPPLANESVTVDLETVSLVEIEDPACFLVGKAFEMRLTRVERMGEVGETRAGQFGAERIPKRHHEPFMSAGFARTSAATAAVGSFSRRSSSRAQAISPRRKFARRKNSFGAW